MTTKHFQNVVIGGGVSAGYFAREWVAHGTKRQLAIYSGEKVVAYERPALSKGFLFPEMGTGGERQDAAWYASHGIEFFTGTDVKSVDVKGKALKIAGGATITYETLVFAPGSTAVTLGDFGVGGGDLGNVLTLRDLADAEALVAAIAEVKAAKGAEAAAVVVGGGYIGVEVGAALVANGLKVTLVFPEDRLLARLFTPEISARYEKAFADKGATLVKGDTVAAVRGGADGKAVGVDLKSSGRGIPADLVIVGTGARPAVGLVDGQLETLGGAPGGVVVDGRLRSSDPSVYAIGDVAAFPIEGGRHSRQEHVQHARESAAYAAREILAAAGESPKAAAKGDAASAGLAAPQPDYAYQPFFYSRFWDFSWQFYGVSTGEVRHFGVVEGDAKFGAIWVGADGDVEGAFLEGGSPEEFAQLKRAVAERVKAPDAGAPQGLSFLASL